MKRLAKIIIILAAVALCAGILTAGIRFGCLEKERSNLPVLSIMYPGEVDKTAVKRISELLSRYTEEKIGCSVKLVNVTSGNYRTEMRQRLLEGEVYDIFFVWELEDLNYVMAGENALELGGYLEDYPVLWEQAENWPWADSFNTGIYGIPDNKDEEYYMGFVCRKSMLGDIKIDEERIYSMEELHDILRSVKSKYPDVVPVISHFGEIVESIGEDMAGDGLAVLAHNERGDYGKSFTNFYSSRMFEDWCNTMYQWNKEGLLDPYLTQNMESQSTNMKENNGFGYFSRIRDYVIPNNEYLLNEELAGIRLSKNFQDNTINSINWCISKETKYPELALDFLNLMYTDSRVFELCRYGEEGVDFVRENDEYTLMEGDGNIYHSTGWIWPYTNKVNEEEKDTSVSPAYGFWFDVSSVQVEMDLCKVVEGKYRNKLLAGEVDPKGAIPRMLEELEEAGIEKIIDEKQRQFEDFLE